MNLIRHLPRLASPSVFDNSAPPNRETGEVEPKHVLRMESGRIVKRLTPSEIPEWTRPIVLAAGETSETKSLTPTERTPGSG